MTRLAATVLSDVRLQLRQGFYYAAAFVLVILVGVTRELPADVLTWLLPVLVFVNIQVNAYYFLAGLVLLEKDEGTLEALVVTPLRPGEYLTSKVVTLAALSVVENGLLVVAAVGLAAVTPSLGIGIVGASVLFSLAGFLTVLRYRSINELLMPSVVYTTLLSVPFLPYFGVVESRLFDLHPFQAPLLLLQRALQGPEVEISILAGSSSLVGAVVGGVLGLRAFHRFVVRRETVAPQRAGNRRHSRAPERASAGATAHESSAPQSSWLGRPRLGRPRLGRPRLGRPRLGRPRLGRLRALLAADFKNVWRDPLLRWMMFLPLVLAAVLRWLAPALLHQLGLWLDVDLSTAVVPLVSFVVLTMAPSLVGMVIGFLLLDHRDEGSLAALEVTPLTLSGYLAYRLSMPMLVAAVATLIMLPLAVAGPIRPLAALVAVAVAAPTAPLFALFIGVFARNKVQGFALMKASGAVTWPPIFAYFVALPWQLLFGLIPMYWPARVYWSALAGESTWALWAIPGLAWQGFLVWLLLRRYRRVALR